MMLPSNLPQRPCKDTQNDLIELDRTQNWALHLRTAFAVGHCLCDSENPEKKADGSGKQY